MHTAGQLESKGIQLALRSYHSTIFFFFFFLNHNQKIFKRNTQQVWSRGDVNLSKQCSLCSFVASSSAAHSLMSTTCEQLQLPCKQRVREIEGERAHTGETLPHPKGRITHQCILINHPRDVTVNITSVSKYNQYPKATVCLVNILNN